MRHLTLLLTLAALLVPGLACFADEAKTKTVEPPAPYPIGSKFSRTVQKVTGINIITQYVASKAAEAAIKKKVGGKVKVKVKTYSLTSLISGKVKAVDVHVIDPSVKGVTAGDINISSDSPFWYNYKKSKTISRGMQTPVLMTVKAKVSEKQIAQALNSPQVTSSLRGLKLDLPGLGAEELAVLNPKVDVDGDRITLDAILAVKGASADTGVPVKISAVPRLEGDSKILLEQLKVDSDGIVEPEKFSAFAETLLNPIIDFGRLDRKDHAFRLKSFKLEGDSVSGDGKLLLAPRGGNTKVVETVKQ